MRERGRSGLFATAISMIDVLRGAAILCWASGVLAGVVDDYNAKPIIAGHSLDSRWQERTRMQNDPEVVLGKDWRRSYWAFSPSFAQQLSSQVENRPPQPAIVSTANLSVGLEAIELRVSWDVEENLYRCGYHLFLSQDVPVLLPQRSIGGTVSIPRYPIGIGPDDSLSRQEWLGTAMVLSSVQMLGGPTILEAIYKIQTGNMTYIAFYQGTCGALAHSSAEKKLRVGVAIEPVDSYSGEKRKIRERTYAVFTVPAWLIQAGAPYFRRASKINDCYFNERRSPAAIAREPAGAREQRELACKQLRQLSVDSTEKPFDIQ